MAIPPAPRPGDNPVVRFRLKSLLTATTVAAVLAAIAGAYYRRQPASVQPMLLAYWACVSLFAVLGLWQNWHKAWRVPPAAGEVRFILWRSHGGFRLFHGRLGQLVLAAMWLGFIASQSRDVVRQAAAGRGLGAASIGLFHGLISGGALFALSRRPTYLADNGVTMGPTYAPWKFIRRAEWADNRSDVLKLHRLEGDIYAKAPADMRGDIEAFVREKTAFVDAPPLAEPTRGNPQSTSQ